MVLLVAFAKLGMTKIESDKLQALLSLKGIPCDVHSQICHFTYP